MDQHMKEILEGKESNCLLPFLWIHSGERKQLRTYIDQIDKSGARAFCVESRPHENFCQNEWWEDLSVILQEAQKRNMKVWILDDKHFPTGYANGLIEQKYPDRRKWHLIEHHVDVLGPMSQASLLMKPLDEEEELLGAFAYLRDDQTEHLTSHVIDLTANVKGRYLYFDVPDGCWRVFFYYKTRKGCASGQEHYIHLIDPDSVQVLIEAVYESHYAHFKPYFGNTLAGFFSDEPSLGNDSVVWGGQSKGFYDKRIGTMGLALPWSDALLLRLRKRLGEQTLSKLAGLWYTIDSPEDTAQIRLQYMDIVTDLYRQSFTQQLGTWCHDHSVEYIGHIIEDMNAHTRLGCSAGHYFRALTGQDMSGIDVVLHQIMPGFAHRLHTASCAGGVADPNFFHYVLGKLAASLAQYDPAMKGRAMCEVFGAYGWAEGMPMMKWLMDHLLVRGVNQFVPHAFSMQYPDLDSPPHFYADGCDPQFLGFSKLMRYVNRVSHLLTGCVHQANAAILYHAEAEWMNKTDYMLTQEPAKALYDAQIDYDIVPMDWITEQTTIQNHQIVLHQETFDSLIVPYAAILPQAFLNAVQTMQQKGGRVIFIDGLPQNISFDAEVVPLHDLAAWMQEHHFFEIHMEENTPLCRCYHGVRGTAHYFMFFNESTTSAVATNVKLQVSGDYWKMDLLKEDYHCGSTADGTVFLELAPYESTILLFDLGLEQCWPTESKEESAAELALTYDIALCEAKKDKEWVPYGTQTNLVNITGFDQKPNFSGTIRYTANLHLDSCSEKIVLDLGEVGQTAQLYCNQQDLGICICKPYRFDISDWVRQGDNSLVIEVANTLVHHQMDTYSQFIQIPPSGLLGPVTLHQFAKDCSSNFIKKEKRN